MSKLIDAIGSWAAAKKLSEKDAQSEAIIRDFLVPQGRFIEAQLWLDGIIRTERDKQELQDLIPTRTQREPFRLPNTFYFEDEQWMDSDTDLEQKKRIALYVMTVREASANQLFMSKQHKASLKDYPFLLLSQGLEGTFENFEDEPGISRAAALEAIALALTDYVEFIVLQGKKKLTPSDADFAKTAASEDKQNKKLASRDAKLQAKHDKFIEKQKAAEQASKQRFEQMKLEATDRHDGLSKGVGEMLRATGGEALRKDYLADFEVANSRKYLRTDQTLVFCRSQFLMHGRWFAKTDLAQLIVSVQHHTEYSGVSASNSEYLVLTLQLRDYTSHQFWISLGNNQADINQTFPKNVQKLQKLAQHYQVVQGEDGHSSGGYTTSFGFGVIS